MLSAIFIFWVPAVPCLWPLQSKAGGCWDKGGRRGRWGSSNSLPTPWNCDRDWAEANEHSQKQPRRSRQNRPKSNQHFSNNARSTAWNRLDTKTVASRWQWWEGYWLSFRSRLREAPRGNRWWVWQKYWWLPLPKPTRCRDNCHTPYWTNRLPHERAW